LSSHSPVTPGLLLALEFIKSKINQLNDLSQTKPYKYQSVTKEKLELAELTLKDLESRIIRALGPEIG